MSTATTIIPRSYKTYQWSTGQTRSWPQPPGLWLPTGHWVDPTTEAGFPWAQAGGIQTAFSIYPRPDTETNGYARHRVWYYDGTTQFKNIIPIIARGGAFPYNFEIISAPANAGASMGAASWDTSWRTPLDAIMAGYGDLWVEPTGACTPADGPLWVRAYGQDGLFTDFIFTGTTIAGYYFDSATPADSYGFVFLDPVNGTDPTAYPSATGTTNNISTPIKTMNWAFGSSNTTQTYPNAILVLRAGTTPTFAQDPQYGIKPVPSVAPQAIIGYPGESVLLDVTNAGANPTSTGYFLEPQPSANDLFFQGWQFIGAPTNKSLNFRYFGAYQNLMDRVTAHNISAPNVYSGSGPTDNASLFEFDDPTTGSPVCRNYIAIKGCSESNRPNQGSNSVALFDMYKCQYVCVELCTVTALNAYGPTPKASIADFTMRSSMIVGGPSGSDLLNLFAQWNSAVTQNIEFCYNIIDQSANAGAGWPLQINGSYSASVPNTDQAFGTIVSCRNSIIGGPIDVNDPDTPISNGPFASVNDAIQYGSAAQAVYINRASGPLPSNVTNTGTTSQAASGIFTDPASGNYTLVNSARIGLDGAQIA